MNPTTWRISSLFKVMFLNGHVSVRFYINASFTVDHTQIFGPKIDQCYGRLDAANWMRVIWCHTWRKGRYKEQTFSEKCEELSSRILFRSLNVLSLVSDVSMPLTRWKSHTGLDHPMTVSFL